MANPTYIEALLGSLPSDQRRVFKQIFEYVLGNLRVGQPDDQVRSENLQAYFYEVTTPATANEEFSIAHGLGRAPYLLIPVLPLSTQGAQIVPLTVSQPADATRVYLTSSTASAPLTVLIEG